MFSSALVDGIVQGVTSAGRNPQAGHQSLKLRLTPPLRCILDHRSKPTGKAPVETLPDLLPLSDDELSTLLAQLEGGEDAISRRRRVLHGRIDILRAERTGRLKAQVAAGSFEATPVTSLERPLYTGTGDVAPEVDLDPLPDLASLDDDALWGEIRRLEKEEDDISLNRRVMHAQIDIVRAERTKRSRGGRHVDPDDLGPILGGGQ